MRTLQHIAAASKSLVDANPGKFDLFFLLAIIVLIVVMILMIIDGVRTKIVPFLLSGAALLACVAMLFLT